MLVSNEGCLETKAAESNGISMRIIPLVRPAITITESANNICPGTGVSFSASVVNGGSTPIYNWQKNGVNVGSQAPGYNETNIANGDRVICLLSCNQRCVTATIATSNIISMAYRSGLPDPVNLGPDKSVCEGKVAILTAGVSYNSYKWQNGNGNNSFTTSKAGTYYVQVQDACGTVSSDTIVVKTNPLPKGFMPADTAICSYSSIVLQSRALFARYWWSTGDQTQTTLVTRPGTYWLTVVDRNGCEGSDTLLVRQKECMKGLYVPTAFTPDRDGKNDILKPFLFGIIKQYEFTIYNRWGEIVFRTSDLNKGWDGTYKGRPQDTNAFVWMCRYELEGEVRKMVKGTLIVIR